MDMYLNAEGSVLCVSCLNGEHISYGDDHRTGDVNRSDCKNTGILDGKLVQCNCIVGSGTDSSGRDSE